MLAPRPGIRPRFFRVLVLLAIATGGTILGQEKGRFDAWLWAGGGPPEKAAEHLKAVGISGLAAEPGFDAARWKQLGLRYYLDQLVPADILSVSLGTYEASMAAGVADPRALARPHCLRDPAVLARAQLRIQEILGSLEAYPPAFVSLRDEPSYGRLINPVDWCLDSRCEEELRAFLLQRYGGLRAMLDTHGLPRDASELDLASMTTHAARRRFLHGTQTPQALSPWNDAREFADASFAQALRTFAEAAKKALPNVPVGFLGGQMPSAFGGFDWSRLIPAMDVVEPYDYGAARHIVRSLETPRSLVLHTLFLEGKPPRACVNELYHYFIRGDRGVILFSGRDAFIEGDWSRPSPNLQALAPHLESLRDAKLDPFRTAPDRGPQVAVLWSMPTIRADWMLDSRRDGAAWPKRLTSYQNANGSQGRTREAWAALLADLGLRFRFVSPGELTAGVLDAQHVDALVLARAVALSDGEVSAITRFTNRGGLLIADAHAGWFSGNLRQRETPPLDSVFGIRTKDTPREVPEPRKEEGSLPYPVAEPGLELARGMSVGRPQREPRGVPVFITGGRFEGRTLYMNLRLEEYVTDRLLNPARARWLRDELRPHFQHAGIRPLIHFFPDDDAPPWPLELVVRRQGEDLYVAAHINVGPATRHLPWDAILARPKLRGRLAFRGTQAAQDLLSGERFQATNSLSVEVAVDRPVFLRLSRP